jgi:Flp pilus assembly secretin CpaC
LRGEVSNEVVYDRVLELVISYLPPKPPQQVAPATSQSVQFGASPIATISSSGLGFAGGGSLAFTEEKSITDPYRWNDKKDIDGIIDMLIIREIRQIELDVTVADVRLDKAREVGFNFQYTGPTDVQSATSLLGPGGTGVVGALSGAFTYVNGAYTLTSLYRMLQNRNIASILAQPRLVVKNGKSGGFLSGGEVPIVTVTANTFGVIFKPFGVRLDFLPTLTQSDRIDLRVFPEVSAIGSNTFAGVPDFIVRRSISRVELKEGESLILGGLLDQQVVKSMAKIPYLGDVPILGALFRSTSFQNRESELIFVITPRIVRTMKAGEVPKLPSLEKFDHEDMRQVPVPGGSDTKKPMGGASIP